MWRLLMRLLLACTLVGLISMITSCATGGGSSVKGNEGGSDPANNKEEVEYKQAVLRCLKTGGTRVVKIEGHLRCY